MSIFGNLFLGVFIFREFLWDWEFHAVSITNNINVEQVHLPRLFLHEFLYTYVLLSAKCMSVGPLPSETRFARSSFNKSTARHLKFSRESFYRPLFWNSGLNWAVSWLDTIFLLLQYLRASQSRCEPPHPFYKHHISFYITVFDTFKPRCIFPALLRQYRASTGKLLPAFRKTTVGCRINKRRPVIRSHRQVPQCVPVDGLTCCPTFHLLFFCEFLYLSLWPWTTSTLL